MANLAVYLNGQWLGIVESHQASAERYWEERNKRFPDRSYVLQSVPVGVVPEISLKRERAKQQRTAVSA
jgi:hypothetical protein